MPCIMPVNNEVLAHHSRRRTGHAPVPAHAASLEAGRADRRQVPADRHPDQQLPARRHPPDLRADAVQFGVAQPPHLADLSHGSLQPGVRRDSRGRADARQSALVPGHGRRRATGGAPLRPLRRRLLPDSRRRSSVPHGLRRAGRRAHRSQRRHHDRRAAGDRGRRLRHGHLPVRSAAARSSRSRRNPTPIDWPRSARASRQASIFAGHTPDKPFVASMGVYVFSRDVLLDMLAADQAKDFGREIIPSALGQYRVQCAPVPRLLGRRRHDRVLLRRQHHADAARRAVQVLRSAAGRSTRTRGSCPGRA